MPPTIGNSANVDLNPQSPSDKVLQQLYSTSSMSPNKSGNVVAGGLITQSEATKHQLKDRSGKQKPLLNTYSSEELLLQAASSLQGLEGKLIN